MLKLTILIAFCLNSCYCFKQPISDYSQSNDEPKLKPQAIIHLPNNVYAHKITDTINLDHEHLSNYLSSINYIPHTIHKHAQMLAQLDPADIQKYGQSVNSNQLPLISLTVPENKNSDYNDAQMKIDDYSAPAPQQDYHQSQPNAGYQTQQVGQQDYNHVTDQQSYSNPQQQSYSPPQAQKKNCNHQNKDDGYGSNQQNNQEYSNKQLPDYGSSGSGYNQDVNHENKSPEMEYQSGPAENNNYESGNNYDSGNNNYESNNGGNSNEMKNENYGQSYGNQQSNQHNQQDYGNSNNEANDYSSQNYESSPFDYNFVQDILRHVMNQLEQLQIDPENLNAYGKLEESNQGSNYENNNQNNYESNSGYEVQGDKQGIQLVDRPDGQEISYGYSINHGGQYESQPSQNEGSSYEPSYTSSSTTSQATSYNANEPAVILDNKLAENKDRSTVTYRMPTINLELPEKKIKHIMKAISGKNKYNQPIMIKSNSFKLPPNLNLGKIKTIAFIKSSKLNNMKELPYFNTEMLSSNVDSLKILKSDSSKKEETNYDSNPVLSAYGYGVSLPSSKLYASSTNKKSAIILPLKSRSRRLGNTYSSLQAASSNLKSIISAKINKKVNVPAAPVEEKKIIY